MFATLLTLALIAAPALAAFEVETPVLTQCAPTKITWSGGKGLTNILLVHPDEPCGPIVADLGDHDGTSLTWTPNLPVGTKVQFSLADENDEEAWSGPITIKAGTDSSCLKAASGSKSASIAPTNTKAVGAAGAAVTNGPGDQTTDDDDSDVDPLGAASGAIPAHHLNPIMAFCALLAAVALAL
ncbi:hypothetical protein C8J57DRAFT_709311 [Mycena rebaudengoi]|nr:hypothetical protein C8J57DRAFT_709311 [Mycena rebaudengoi]